MMRADFSNDNNNFMTMPDLEFRIMADLWIGYTVFIWWGIS
jgi:hypothetical protein